MYINARVRYAIRTMADIAGVQPAPVVLKDIAKSQKLFKLVSFPTGSAPEGRHDAEERIGKQSEYTLGRSSAAGPACLQRRKVMSSSGPLWSPQSVIDGRKTLLEKGYFTALPVDAIVFYAREDLALGAGFGTAIQTRGGAAVKRN